MTQTEKENQMLNPNSFDYFSNVPDENPARKHENICPICDEYKFKQNDVCMTCQSMIRADFLKFIANYGLKKEDYVVNVIVDFIDIL